LELRVLGPAGTALVPRRGDPVPNRSSALAPGDALPLRAGAQRRLLA